MTAEMKSLHINSSGRGFGTQAQFFKTSIQGLLIVGDDLSALDLRVTRLQKVVEIDRLPKASHSGLKRLIAVLKPPFRHQLIEKLLVDICQIRGHSMFLSAVELPHQLRDRLPLRQHRQRAAGLVVEDVVVVDP